jgi:hypothetical protein
VTDDAKSPETTTHVALPIDQWNAMVQRVGGIPTTYGHAIMKVMEHAVPVSIPKPRPATDQE